MVRAVCLAAGAFLLVNGCRLGKGSPMELDVSQLPGRQDPAARFAQYYVPVEVGVTAAMPSYDLPLTLDQVSNLAKVESLYLRNAKEKEFFPDLVKVSEVMPPPTVATLLVKLQTPPE